MKGVIDIIVKDGRAIVIVKRPERAMLDQMKKQIREMHEDIRKIEVMGPLTMFEQPNLMKDMFDGFSLMSHKNFFENFGLQKFTRYMYSLEQLDNSKKAMFSYALVGRRGNPGLLNKFNGLHLGKGVVTIPSENEKQVEGFLGKWNVKFKKDRYYRW